MHGLARRMEPIAEKVKPVIEKTKDTIYQIGQAAKETAGKVWEKTKSIGKKVLSWFGF